MKTLKRTLALVMSVCMLLGIATTVTPAAAVETPAEVTLLRAEQTGAKSLSVVFSASVDYAGGTLPANLSTAIQLVDNADDQNLQWTGGTAGSGDALEWTGTLYFHNLTGPTGSYNDGPAKNAITTDPTNAAPDQRHELRFELTGAMTLGGQTVDTIDEILALTAAGGDYEGCTVVFSIIETTVVNPNGTVDGIWLCGNSSVGLTATKTNATDSACVPVTQPAVTLDNVYCYNDDTIVVEFSQAVYSSGGYFMGVRLVDENNQLQQDGEDWLQWGFEGYSYYGQYGNATYGNRLVGKINGATLSQIQAKADELGLYVKLCIEESGYLTGGGNQPRIIRSNGYVDNFYPVNSSTSIVCGPTIATPYEVPNLRVQATVPYGVGYGYQDSLYVDITPVTDSITVQSAEITGPGSVRVTFSEPVTFSKQPNAPAPFVGLVDSSGALVNYSGNSAFYWGGSFTTTDDPAVYIFNMDSQTFGIRNNIADIKALTAEGAAYSDLTMVFCTGQSTIDGDVGGYVDNVTSLDGLKMLTSNAPGGWFHSAPMTGNVDTTALTLDSVELINDSQVIATFSEPVNIIGADPFLCLRLVHPNGALVWDDTTPMQFYGEWQLSEDRTQITWTMNATNNTYGLRNISELLEYKGLDAFTGYDIRFIIEEAPNEPAFYISLENGGVDNLISDGYRTLTATYALTTDRNSAQASISAAFDTAPITVTQVEQVSENDLIITFSESVKVSGSPFLALRMVGDDGVMIWTGGAWDQGTPMQWWSKSWNFTDASQTQIRWTMHPENTFGASNLTDLATYSSKLGLDAYSSYKIQFCIEESPAVAIEGRENTVNDRLVSNFTAIDSVKKLSATLINYGRSDGSYTDVQWADYSKTAVTVTAAEQINESQIVLTFSEPVEIIGTPYMALRMVDETGILFWDGGAWGQGAPMQWTGGWAWYNETHTQIVWTMSRADWSAYGITNLTDLFNYKGIENFSDRPIKFCIEETDSVSDAGVSFVKADGLLCNIKSANRIKHLSGNLWKADYTDSVYTDVTKLYIGTGDITLTGAQALNDSQLLVTFSESIEIVGSTFTAIRLVDADGKMVWDGGSWGQGTPMQWWGYWQYANAQQTQILWTMNGDNTYGVRNLADVLNFVGDLAAFSDYSLRFCIEEGPMDDRDFFTGNHLLESVYGRNRDKALSGTLFMGEGYRDGAYVAITGSLPVKTLTVTEARVISDTEIVVTFSDPVEFVGNPYFGVRLVDENNNLMWSSDDPENRDPLQWHADWKYENAQQTQIRVTLRGGGLYGLSNIPDLLSYSGELAAYTKYDFKLCIEEMDEPRYGSNGMVENITLRSDSRFHLLANLTGGRDGAYIEIKNTVSFKNVTASAAILNDTQMLVTFSAPVKLTEDSSPWICIRYMKDGRLLWNGEENNSTPIQFSGTWEWYGTSGTQMLWTMNGGNSLGADNLYDVLYYQGALAQFSDAPIAFCIEEYGPASVIDNGFVDSFVTRDGVNHLKASYNSHYDGRYMYFENILPEEKLEVVSVKAVDNTTLEITFSGSVKVSDGDDAPTIDIRYLSPSGNIEALPDGRMAIFAGNTSWKDEAQTVLVWKLDVSRARGAESLTDILNFEGDFYENYGSTVALCIYEPDDAALPGKWNGRIDGISSTDGLRRLATNKRSEIGKSQYEIEVLYDLPAPSWETGGKVDPTENTGKTGYLWLYLTCGGLLLATGIFCLIMALKRRKKQNS